MKNFEKKIKEYLEERNWNDLRPADVAKSIMIEGAELLEIFQWDNPTVAEIKKNPEKLTQIKKELADIMIYCFDLAVILNIDVEKNLNDKLEKVKAKYPKEIFNKNKYKKSSTATREEYWKIKNKYRR